LRTWTNIVSFFFTFLYLKVMVRFNM